MNWNLPISTTIDGETYHITNDCDYRVVLDVIETLNDMDLDDDVRVIVALLQFYAELTRDNVTKCPHLEQLVNEMYKIISAGTEEKTNVNRPALMDWGHDMPILAPSISRVLGYSVRDASKYTHWLDFVGAYQEIGESVFSTVISIRDKRAKGKKLEKWELDFFREHSNMVTLPQKMTTEERELLSSEW